MPHIMNPYLYQALKLPLLGGASPNKLLYGEPWRRSSFPFRKQAMPFSQHLEIDDINWAWGE